MIQWISRECCTSQKKLKIFGDATLPFAFLFLFPVSVSCCFFSSCAECRTGFVAMRGLWRPCPKVFHLSLHSICSFYFWLYVTGTRCVSFGVCVCVSETFWVIYILPYASCATFQVDREKLVRLFHSYFSFPFLYNFKSNRLLREKKRKTVGLTWRPFPDAIPRAAGLVVWANTPQQ